MGFAGDRAVTCLPCHVTFAGSFVDPFEAVFKIMGLLNA